MAEYIERDKIRESYEKLTRSYVHGDPYIADWRFDEMIESLPAADVAPVRHGRWLCVDTDTEQFFLCNRCKKKEYWESNYCPNCGAKMDGGNEDGKTDV